MNRLYLLTAFFLSLAALLRAQPFITPTYTYDSLPDVVYGTATGFDGLPRTLQLDIYTPNDNGIGTRPLLVWIHGGAFLDGSKNDPSITRLCKAFARRGYVTASISYRLGFVADDTAHTCNFPNYSCIFATDVDEWPRALYRAVQDAKGALRYLVNRHAEFCIDTNNVFVAGESAGAITALGVGLLDTVAERPAATFARPDAPAPHASATGCVYNQTLPSGTLARPDLGGIEGAIEPTTIQYTIKGIGNMYGAVFADWLKLSRADRPKPAIYAFHRPCDLIVPIDSAAIFWGLSWCFTNGYNCYAVSNSPKIYGSRILRDWNTANGYGYTIQSEFTNTNFPYNFWFGTGSCVDQTSNSCHAYDNATLRESQLATFFAGLITPGAVCLSTRVADVPDAFPQPRIYPNPAADRAMIEFPVAGDYRIVLLDGLGRVLRSEQTGRVSSYAVPLHGLPTGPIAVFVSDASGRYRTLLLFKS